MKAGTFFDVITAAHYTNMVQGEFKSRGGILLVAPPEQLKTTFVEILSNYHNALVLTDIVTRDIAKVRDLIASGRYVTLALPELQKIYNRDADTAANIEGNLRALMEEGFSYVPGSSPDMRVSKAKALIVAGATTYLYQKNFDRWKNDGFARRMLICLYNLKNPYILVEAVEKWKKIEIENGLAWAVPVNTSIEHSVTEQEAKAITSWCRWQAGFVDPALLLHRILSVLRWRNKRFGRKDTSWEVLKDFSESLGKNGAEVEL